MSDVVAGHMNMMFNSIAPIVGHIKAGRLRVLGIASAQRSQQLPEVPTIAEAGVPGFEAVNWFGMFAPAKTPKRIISRLNQAVVKVMRNPEIQSQFLGLGADSVGTCPEMTSAMPAAPPGRLSTTTCWPSWFASSAALAPRICAAGICLLR